MVADNQACNYLTGASQQEHHDCPEEPFLVLQERRHDAAKIPASVFRPLTPPTSLQRVLLLPPPPLLPPDLAPSIACLGQRFLALATPLLRPVVATDPPTPARDGTVLL